SQGEPGDGGGNPHQRVAPQPGGPPVCPWGGARIGCGNAGRGCWRGFGTDIGHDDDRLAACPGGVTAAPLLRPCAWRYLRGISPARHDAASLTSPFRSFDSHRNPVAAAPAAFSVVTVVTGVPARARQWWAPRGSRGWRPAWWPVCRGARRARPL